ncbi:cytochrome c oxidase subunit 3 [Rhodoblastus sp.]|uniref:cytochrome c oxidase subunit 3 n=1 Tax=Rhodoblastus sp. TaxID=1962975 RepID=UPI003F94A583
MIIIAIFLSLLAAGAAWYLAGQNLASKPWLEQGVIGDLSDPDARKAPAARMGVIVFLAVAGSLFALLASAYVMRAAGADWLQAPMPRVLWINTAVLILSSLALQACVHATRRGDTMRARHFLLAAVVLALAFLAGQLVAWRQFAAAGYFLSTNPANSFFYLLTGLHGAHLAGGLAALGVTFAKAAQTGVELCALYWHFLLAVWLILFALLSGWAGDIVVICRGLAG